MYGMTDASFVVAFPASSAEFGCRMVHERSRVGTSSYRCGVALTSLVALLPASRTLMRWRVCRKATSSTRPRRKSKSRGFGASPVKKTSSAPKKNTETENIGQPVDAEDWVTCALNNHGTALIAGLREKGWWVSDGPVLRKPLRAALRQEVEALWNADKFEKSQSVRGGTEYYDKENVYATELNSDKYDFAPRLIHYTVGATKRLSEFVSNAFPSAQLTNKYIGNKLNLCAGNGATFDPHLDVGVGEKPFNRKLTLLLYLNDWKPPLGGNITLLGYGATEREASQDPRTAAANLPVSIAPTDGRWVAFWSDQILHRVEPSQAPEGLAQYRCSYTIWLCTEDEPSSGVSSEVTHTTVSKVVGTESAPSFASF